MHALMSEVSRAVHRGCSLYTLGHWLAWVPGLLLCLWLV
jgi:hypothetical protein